MLPPAFLRLPAKFSTCPPKRKYKIRHQLKWYFEFKVGQEKSRSKNLTNAQKENPSQMQRDSFEKWLNVKFD